ncbi:unnamed protein product, partial [Hapterophycus canaliculatus]
MTVWTTTRLSVGEANTLITVVSMVVSYCMSLMLASISLEIRRLMVIRGKRDAIIQDEEYSGMWKVWKASKARRWTTLAILPILLSGAASFIIEFTTSGVSASIGHTEGAEVQVLGLVGKEVKHRTWSNTPDEPGVYVYGNEYETPISVEITFCVEVTEIGDAFAITDCREGLIVDKSVKLFNVLSSATGVFIELQGCSTLYEKIPLGNQGVGIVERDFTFEGADGTEVAAAATCSSIFESVIESCVWEISGILYFGDWYVTGAGECNDTMINEGIPIMGMISIDYGERVEQGEDTASLLAAITAEIFAGTGLLSSRQQLVDVLGAVVRLESMAWDVQTAYDPVDVVEIGVSAWVLVVLLLSLLLPAMGWGLAKWHSRGKNFFLPVSPAEWSACAARELGGELGKEDGPRSLVAGKPLPEHYEQVFAFGQVVGADEEVDGLQQRLGWVKRSAITPATTEKLSPF